MGVYDPKSIDGLHAFELANRGLGGEGGGGKVV